MSKVGKWESRTCGVQTMCNFTIVQTLCEYNMLCYGEFGLIPRNIANSSQTCADKRPKNRPIKEIGRKVVQKCAHRSVRNIVSEDVRKLIKIWMINKRFVSLQQNWSLL